MPNVDARRFTPVPAVRPIDKRQPLNIRDEKIIFEMVFEIIQHRYNSRQEQALKMASDGLWKIVEERENIKLYK